MRETGFLNSLTSQICKKEEITLICVYIAYGFDPELLSYKQDASVKKLVVIR